MLYVCAFLTFNCFPTAKKVGYAGNNRGKWGLTVMPFHRQLKKNAGLS